MSATAGGAGADTWTLTAGEWRVELAIATDRLAPVYGPRFDRTAQVTRVSGQGVDYLGAGGLPDEFGLRGCGVLGFEATGGAGHFLKIGVGRLRHAGDGPYSFAVHYPVLERAAIEVTARDRESLAIAQAARLDGWAYRYTKAYRLSGDGQLTIRYGLENDGEQAWEFEQYNHNFLCFDGRPVDAAYLVRPAFVLPVLPAESAWAMSAAGLALKSSAPERGGVVWAADLAAAAVDNAVVVHHAAGPALTMRGDFPVSRFALWAVRDALCPEVFFRTRLEPGQRATWLREYAFGFAV